ncbi:MAG: hypothetical protein COW54_02285 [Rhodobacteraceae bacterium CG17_big_fil_post_rev_8_21_14_2_50_63_15]|nr:hypothetical protein [Roseovarius sp.]PIV79795.1 MAG: hypothetical protein COW54_02285 [Rhodobacteraceae bacterium CG17_big_fil_post_rev_8_21_14_2_50_63_15]
MTDDAIQVTIVRAGGTATVKFADGYETMRVATGYLHDPSDGLIAEMREGREATPWQSKATRDEAEWSVETRLDLDDATRRELLDWIAGTAYFEA